MQVIAGVYLVMLVMFHCFFHRCELSKWSKCIKNMASRCWQWQNCTKLAPTVALESPHCRCISIRADALSCCFPRSPMPIPSLPKQWHNCSGCVFLSCWVAGSVLKSWRHVSWQSTASAECGRMRSPQVLPYSAHSPELRGDPMEIHISNWNQGVCPKKNPNCPKQPINQ